MAKGPPTTWCGARSTSFLVHRNLFWQLSRDGNLHLQNHRGRGGGDTLEDGRRRGRQRTASKTGHHCPCRNYPQEPRAKKAGGGSLVPRRPNRSRDWSELIGPLVQRRHTGLRSFLLRGGLRLKRMRASVLIRFPWHEFYYWFIFIFFAWQTKLLLCEGRRTIGSLTQNKLCDYVAVKVRYLVGVLSPVSHEGLH